MQQVGVRKAVTCFEGDVYVRAVSVATFVVVPPVEFSSKKPAASLSRPFVIDEPPFPTDIRFCHAQSTFFHSRIILRQTMPRRDALFQFAAFRSDVFLNFNQDTVVPHEMKDVIPFAYKAEDVDFFVDFQEFFRGQVALFHKKIGDAGLHV
jgi:hypothetical protein